jgi:FkbM family methyltransferase
LSAYDIPEPLLGGPFEQIQTDVGPLWVLASDEVMRDYLRHAGTWEREEGRLLTALLRPGVRFLDVGANVGYFSAFVGRNEPSAVIHAVEPNPDVLPLLRFNLWANGLAVTIWPVALGAGRGAAMLTTTPSNVGDTRAGVLDSGAQASTVVPIASGDELWPEATFDLVKVDVQGGELDAIRGMLGVLKRNPSVVLVVELWPSALRERGDDPVAVARAYEELGFHVAVQIGDELRHLSASEIVAVCDSGGVYGQVNLVLRWL